MEDGAEASVVFTDDAEDTDPVFARFPGPVAISQSRFSNRTRLIGGLGCIVALSVPGVLLLVSAIAVASFGWGLFAFAELMLCLFMLVAASLRKGRQYVLVLDQDGFKVANGRVYQSCRWVDVEGFRLAGVIRLPRIRFKNRSPSARRRVILGLGEDWLKFFLPRRDAALAGLMNRWRERALATAATTGPKHEISQNN